MELHESLRALAQQHGATVFSDAASLRGALDDVLDEGAATAGDINLLVDAVRIGAFASMLGTIERGAEPMRAVEEAALVLARDRGSFDVGGSRWALAALGYAVGQVSDPLVRRYRTGHRPPPGAPPTTGAPVADLTTSPRPVEPPTVVPRPPGPPPSGPPPSGPPPGWWPAAPPGGPPLPGPRGPGRRSVLLPVLTVVLLLALVTAGGVTAVVLTRDDGSTSAGDGGDGGDQPSSLDPEEIDGRYAALGTSVTAAADACDEEEPGPGETEHLVCPVTGGRLDLVTYDSGVSAEEARERVIAYDVGARSQIYPAGTAFYSYDASQRSSPGGPSQVYWDDTDALVSAHLVGDSATRIGLLVNHFKGVSSPIEIPREPVDRQLREFMTYADFDRCHRVHNYGDGELEEDLCNEPGGIYVYSAAMASEKALTAFRAGRRQLWEDSGVNTNTSWNYRGQADAGGTLFQYADQRGRAILYWDLPACGCYAEAYLGTGDHDALYDWWTS